MKMEREKEKKLNMKTVKKKINKGKCNEKKKGR